MRISDWSSDVCSSDLDLIDGLNDLRPHVVHFSGHAGDGLLFDTADPTMPGDHLVGYDHVANLLGATDETPALGVRNACNTADGNDIILEVASVVIAPNATNGGTTSLLFAVHAVCAIAPAQ